jgi:ubiquinone/menaquinone biosynthesis C-methylase UbiE
MNRVVVPGGQVMILEMTVPHSGLFRGLYSIYLNRVLPTSPGSSLEIPQPIDTSAIRS